MKSLNWVKTNYKTLLVLLLITIFQFKKNIVESKEMNNMEREQRFIELQVNSSKINYYLNFNGTKVFSEFKESPISETIPVNHWMLNGDNRIRVGVNFRDQEKAIKAAQSAELTVSVILRIKNGDRERSHTLSKFDLAISQEKMKLVEQGKLSLILKDKDKLIASDSWGKNSIDLKKLFLDSTTGIIKVEDWKSTDEQGWTDFDQIINMDLGYPEWAYLTADYLGPSEGMSDDEYFALSDDLYLEYKKIWELMKAKNKAALLPMFELRASEFDAAYYLPKGEKYGDMEYSLDSAFNHETLSLSEMVTNEYAQLSIVAYGKVAILRVAGPNEPLLYYSHKRGAFTRFYDLYFMRKDGKWMIIR